MKQFLCEQRKAVCLHKGHCVACWVTFHWDALHDGRVDSPQPPIAAPRLQGPLTLSPPKNALILNSVMLRILFFCLICRRMILVEIKISVFYQPWAISQMTKHIHYKILWSQEYYPAPLLGTFLFQRMALPRDTISPTPSPSPCVSPVIKIVLCSIQCPQHHWVLLISGPRVSGRGSLNTHGNAHFVEKMARNALCSMFHLVLHLCILPTCDI